MKRKFVCYDCGYSWEILYGTPRPNFCPKCGSVNIHRAQEDRGYARGNARGCGRKGPPWQKMR